MSSNLDQEDAQGPPIPSNAGSGGSGPLKNPLLHAWHDPLAGIKTSSACLRLVDLHCDGDAKLVVCDYDKKLRVYQGTRLLTDYAILDAPIAMCITYTEHTLPRIPSIAVAAGPHVFIYRQLRPYRKWTAPCVDISPSETEVWAALVQDTLSLSAGVQALRELRETGVALSARSAEFLALFATDNNAYANNNNSNNNNNNNAYNSANINSNSYANSRAAAFLAEIKELSLPLSPTPSLITCMDTLKKDSEESDAVSLLVVGTESGQVLILPQDPQASHVLCKINLPTVPALLSISGVFDVEWRISVIGRDGKLYFIKNGESRGSALLVGGSAVDLGSAAVCVVRQEKLLWIATMDRNVSCYSTRGKRLRGMLMSEDVAEMCSLPIKRAKVSHLLMVALINGDISIYKDLTPIHTFRVDRPVLACVFGLYGREENTLVLVHGRGSLTIKIWKRLAEVENLSFNVGPPPEQDIPLPVPKKTKLYVEQTQREREKAPEIHRGFQRDLCKLRLTTARAYVKTLTDGTMNTSSTGNTDVRIQVQVLGLGPKFVLRITLQNSGTQPLLQTRLVFSFDEEQYAMGFEPQSVVSIALPVLLPGPRTVCETSILSVDPLGRAGQIYCLLFQDNNTLSGAAPATNCSPLLTAAVKMPPAEPMLF